MAKFFTQLAHAAEATEVKKVWQAAATKMLAPAGVLYNGRNFDPPKFELAVLKDTWDFLPQPLIGQLRSRLMDLTGPFLTVPFSALFYSRVLLQLLISVGFT